MMAQAPNRHSVTTSTAKHAPAKHKPKAIEEHRGSARERGYTTAWDDFAKAFRSSHPLCEFCLARGVFIPAHVVDHDLPHRQDPELFWSNTFTSLCGPCHNGTKKRLEARLSGDALLDAIKALKAPKHERSHPG